MTCPTPRAWKRIAVITILVAMGALTACSASGTRRVSADARSSPAPSGSADAGTLPSAPVVPTASPTGAPTPTKAAGPARNPAPPLPGVSAAAQAVLEQVNAWRTAAGLRPYVMLPGLIASAHKHNLTMAAGCGLSHQCKGEAPFGDRIHAEGVNWSSAGENCGVGGGVANTTTAVTGSATGLDRGMFNEKAPNDGHRRNLLSSGFTHIGIDVIRDSKGNVWITQDFTS